MCPCRPCSEILSTLGWNIKGCEARPMMTCWMNLWRLCHRGKIILALRSGSAHRLWTVSCWHVDEDSTWCYWVRTVKQFSIVPAGNGSQNVCNWKLWISSPDHGLVSLNSEREILCRYFKILLFFLSLIYCIMLPTCVTFPSQPHTHGPG